jgi:hypothetical protein
MGDNSRTMTAKEFDTILKQLGLTRPAAGKALGLSQRTVASYAHSRQKLPRWLELAVKGLLSERASEL